MTLQQIHRNPFRLVTLVLASLIFCAPALAADHGRSLWTDVAARPLPTKAPQVTAHRALVLDVAGMQARLAASRDGSSVTLTLPKPEGGFATFTLSDSHTLPPELQRRYPGIISLAGVDAAGQRVRVDLSPARGFQAMVFADQGLWVVRPEQLGGAAAYMSFFRSKLQPPERHQLGPDVVIEPFTAMRLAQRPAVVPLTDTGETTRNYRIAVAANGEYVAAVGSGTKPGGLAAVTQAINRVNQVYETELGVHLTLVANNDDIIYTNAVSDPYNNDTSDLGTNQTVLDSVIGNASYDVGHVFTTGSGGVALLGVTCLNLYKAQGTTGLSNPTGDAFWIDFVAHELGHQFGANHPFNSTQQGSCTPGNRNAATAYEPGSGSSIMSYAGICGINDLQPHSDPYFHAISLNEIDTWIEGAGGNCATETASTDAAPVINTGSLPTGYTLPMHTPFALTASASDPNGDPLTYNWEQFDLGSVTDLSQGDIGNGPIFRSWNATTSGTRSFPALSTVLGGPLLTGEAWPVTNRALNFRLTVRDNHGVPANPQFGRSTSADVALTVSTSAGPFQVTQPNTGVTWPNGSSQTVTWDVAGTNLAPISCPTVAIRMSTDGGASFPTLLASGAANDGSQAITVAGGGTGQARVKIACENNIFYDISDTDFTIGALPNLIFKDGFEPPPTQPLQDPSFEATTGDGGSNPYWQGSDSAAGAGATSFYSNSGFSIPTHTGNWAIWFGGYGPISAYTQSASQTVTLANVPSLFINFYMQVGGAAANTGDILSIGVDGNYATVDASTLTPGTSFVANAVDISAFADGGSHTIELRYSHDGSGANAFLYIDDVTVDTTSILARPRSATRSE